MERLARYILNGLTAISLLLCSLVLLAWLSGRSEMIWVGRNGYPVFEIGWHDGRIFASSITLIPPLAQDTSLRTFHHPVGAGSTTMAGLARPGCSVGTSNPERGRGIRFSRGKSPGPAGCWC
jgi:hypothetical protein